MTGARATGRGRRGAGRGDRQPPLRGHDRTRQWDALSHERSQSGRRHRDGRKRRGGGSQGQGSARQGAAVSLLFSLLSRWTPQSTPVCAVCKATNATRFIAGANDFSRFSKPFTAIKPTLSAVTIVGRFAALPAGHQG